MAGVEGILGVATASHSIAAAYGYEDGENIPVDLMIDAVARIVAATHLPVTADLEAGYGNAGETIRRAIGVGVVGANIEDQMKPLPEAVGVVEAVVAAGQAEGVEFVLNARTDAFIKAGDRPHAEVLADAIERGSAYLAAGAPVVFVPGGVSEDDIVAIVDSWFRAQKTGDYYGQCAELCGKEHAYMPIHVKVLSQPDYAAWVEGKMKEMAALADDPAKTWQLAELVARGEKVYNANCAACHRPDGKGAGPIKPLDGSAIVLNNPAAQLQILLNGAANGAMPAWKQLSDTELAAVITYTKNSWNNRTGKLVQPAEVVAARK